MTDAPQDPEFVLRGVAGTTFGRSFHLLAPTTVGRSPECDICLDEAGISRLHARLRPMDFGLEIEDAGSTNGSFLNGQRIGVAIARVGDEVAFDRLRFRVGEPRKPQAAGPATGTRKASGARGRWGLVALAVAAVVVLVVVAILGFSGA
jgi:hypothetical protein